MVSDKEYPQRVAFSLITQMLIDYEKTQPNGAWKAIDKDQDSTPDFLATHLSKFQNPKEADKLMKIQKDLDEVKDIMVKNIDDLLQRGMKLDDLMEKSNDLSDTSKHFYKQAKKTNACCKY